MSTEYPVVVSSSDNTVTLGFTHEGQEVRIELAKTMIKGQAQWAAKRLAAKGASIPEYGTKERVQWAKTLQQATGVSE